MNITELNLLIDEVNEGLDYLNSEVDIHPQFDAVVDANAISSNYHHAQSLISEITMNGCNKEQAHLINQLAGVEWLSPNHFTVTKSALGQDIALESIGDIIGNAFKAVGKLLKAIWDAIIALGMGIFKMVMKVSRAAIGLFTKGEKSSTTTVSSDTSDSARPVERRIELKKKCLVDIVNSQYGPTTINEWVSDATDSINEFVANVDKSLEMITSALLSNSNAKNVMLTLESLGREVRSNRFIEHKMLVIYVDFLKRMKIVDSGFRLDPKTLKDDLKTLTTKWAEYKTDSKKELDSGFSYTVKEWKQTDYFDEKILKKLDSDSLLDSVKLAEERCSNFSTKIIEVNGKKLGKVPKHNQSKIFDYKDRLLTNVRLLQLVLNTIFQISVWHTEIRSVIAKETAKGI